MIAKVADDDVKDFEMQDILISPKNDDDNNEDNEDEGGYNDGGKG